MVFSVQLRLVLLVTAVSQEASDTGWEVCLYNVVSYVERVVKPYATELNYGRADFICYVYPTKAYA